MTFKSYHKVVYLLFVGLLLAMLLVPMTATLIGGQAAAHDAPHFTLFQGEATGPTAVIACIPQDPSGSSGGCGGG
jgi:hypothetical protein